MKKDVADFIYTCQTCHNANIYRQSQHVFYSRFHLLLQSKKTLGWILLSTYLLTSRPTKAADLFTNIVCKHHGFSKSIISCRDPIFLSKSWKTLLQLDDTKLRMSTTYHPQLDGQFEVLNIYLQQYHRHLFIKNHLQGVNTSPGQSAKDITPFQVVYGKPPPSTPSYILGSTNIKVVDTIIATMEEIFHHLRKKLLKAKKHMKIKLTNIEVILTSLKEIGFS